MSKKQVKPVTDASPEKIGEEIKSRRKRTVATVKDNPSPVLTAKDAVKSRRKKKSPKKASPQELSEVVQRADANAPEYPSDLPDLIPASTIISSASPVVSSASLKTRRKPTKKEIVQQNVENERILENTLNTPQQSPQYPPDLPDLIPASPVISSPSPAASPVVAVASPVVAVASPVVAAAAPVVAAAPLIETPLDALPIAVPLVRSSREEVEQEVDFATNVNNKYSGKTFNIEPIQNTNLSVGEYYIFQYKRYIGSNILSYYIGQVTDYTFTHYFQYKIKVIELVNENISNKKATINLLNNQPTELWFNSYENKVFEIDTGHSASNVVLTNENIKKYVNYYCTNKHKKLPDNLKDISKWDISNITDMSFLFYNLEVDDKIENWDVSNVSNMQFMFYLAKSKKTIDFSKWNVKNVVNMQQMFCKTKLNITNIFKNTDNVRNMFRMFENCKINFTLEHMNVQNVENFTHMFNSCKNFGADVKMFKLTPGNRANKMAGMFTLCVLTDKLNIDFDVSNVTDMSYMFYESQVNFELNFNSSNVVNISNMFFGATITKDFRLDTRNVRNMSYMFHSCKYNSWERLNDVLDTRNVQSMTGLFKLNTSIKNVDLRFNTENVTDMSNMFSGSTYNGTLSFNTINCNDFSYMFYQNRFFNKPVNFNTENGTDFSHMFESATRFNQPNINFTIREGANVDRMFDDTVLHARNQLPEFYLVRVTRRNNAVRNPAGIAFEVHNAFRNINKDEIRPVLCKLMGKNLNSYDNIPYNTFITETRDKFMRGLNEIPIVNDKESINKFTERDLQLNRQCLTTILNKASRASEMRTMIPYVAPAIDYMFLPAQKNLLPFYIKKYILENSNAYGRELLELNETVNESEISCVKGIMERFVLVMEELMRDNKENKEYRIILTKIFKQGVPLVTNVFNEWMKNVFYNPDFVDKLPTTAKQGEENTKDNINKARVEFSREEFVKHANVIFNELEMLNTQTKERILYFANTIDTTTLGMADYLVDSEQLGGRKKTRRRRKYFAFSRHLYR